MSDKKTVKVKLVKSIAGTKESHRATVRGLGLRKHIGKCQRRSCCQCRLQELAPIHAGLVDRQDLEKPTEHGSLPITSSRGSKRGSRC